MAVVVERKQYTEEELLAMQEQQILASNKQYIKLMEHSLKVMKELDPKDRLDRAHAIWVVIECMKVSLKGWDMWLNLRSMKLMTDKELKNVVPTLKELALKWIQLDIEITQAKTNELLAQVKKKAKEAKAKKKPKKKRSSRSKDIYVA